MKAGAVVKDVYNAIVQKVRDEKPDLEQYFVKTLGFAVCTLFPPPNARICPC